MGIRQWINRAATARKKWFGSYKKKWAEKRARKRERELQRQIDVAMQRTPDPEAIARAVPDKPVPPPEDDWFTPITSATPST